MVRPYLRRRASGDTRDDRHRVARLYRRLALGELPDVPVVHVVVHKAARPSVGGREERFERGVLAREPVGQLPYSPPLPSVRAPSAHYTAERRRRRPCLTHTTQSSL